MSPYQDEAALPRVPLPALEDSCERFLEWCAPLLSPDELAATEAAAAAFLAPGSAAHVLQAALADEDAREDGHSWLDAFWAARYLGRRDRIALNANFFFLLREDDLGQLEQAARLVASAVAYQRRVDAGELEQVVQQGRPQSMEQHLHLFSTTRLPGPVQDTVRGPYGLGWPGPSPARHIAVLSRGRVFAVDVLTADGRPYAPAELVQALDAVLASGSGRGEAVGALTTQARAEWATTRQALLDADPANAVALDTVETALLCLCLEDVVPAGEQQACDLLLHGDSGNRWFDKALSLVVFGDGTAGLNAEHAMLDGTTILALVDALLTGPAPDGPGGGGVPAVRPVPFLLDAPLRATVQAAADAFADYAAATATLTVAFPDFGAEDAKRLGTSPDAFVQLAYQLAHQRTKGMVGATYESVATRHFRHGRTEAMRVVTPEVLRFVAAMTSGADDATRREALRAAADRHVARARQCQAGQAPEQHLWELQLLQRRRGAELGATGPLPLHDSPGWRVMREDHLSTSSAPSANIRYFGFGSTSPQCIGVAYVLLPERFHLYLSTPRAVGEHLAVFAAELRRAVGEMRELLQTRT